MSRISSSLFAVISLLVITLVSLSWGAPDTAVVFQQQTPTPVAPQMPPPKNDDWLIVDLPATATQLEYGAEVYRLVCKACHGDKGQGLTDDWRAQWAPDDQNCWQSKCHAVNHPPDGFYMPVAPAVVGAPVQGFGTALDLYNYINKFMPWHNPGSMNEKDSWSVTAYILKLNNIEPGADLSSTTAVHIRLKDNSLSPGTPARNGDTGMNSASEEHVNPKTYPIAPFWAVVLIIVALLIFVGILALYRRSVH